MRSITFRTEGKNSMTAQSANDKSSLRQRMKQLLRIDRRSAELKDAHEILWRTALMLQQVIDRKTYTKEQVLKMLRGDLKD